MPLSPISPTGVSTAFRYPVQASAGGGINQFLQAGPGNINTPIIFEPGPELTNGVTQLFIVATGRSPNWGGCAVYISPDNTTYEPIGTIFRAGVQGVLSAAFASGSDPDTTNTLSVDVSMSQGTIVTATDGDADLGLSLAYCDGELICYSTATLTSTYNYNLTTYIRRGFYGSTISSHAAGTNFALLGSATFREDFLQQYIGETIYFKFPSFNTLGGQLQDIADCTVYTYVITGSGLNPAGQSCAVDVGLAAGASEDWGNLGEVIASSCDWGELGTASTLSVDLGDLRTP